ncbi:hypothetical protein M3558_10570 [Brevibacillus invocatus]|nr:hypothetical protein [Brevibacillus invocatus]
MPNREGLGAIGRSTSQNVQHARVPLCGMVDRETFLRVNDASLVAQQGSQCHFFSPSPFMIGNLPGSKAIIDILVKIK